MHPTLLPTFIRKTSKDKQRPSLISFIVSLSRYQTYAFGIIRMIGTAKKVFKKEKEIDISYRIQVWERSCNSELYKCWQTLWGTGSWWTSIWYQSSKQIFSRLAHLQIARDNVRNIETVWIKLLKLTWKSMK